MKKQFELRGVMLDPARLTERRHVYRDLIPWLARWGYNTLLWHFTDDQGCALAFPSHPEIAGPHAWSPREMRALIAFAHDHGITIIPEVESLGHTDCITRIARYKHLRDGTAGKIFQALCPVHPGTRAVIGDLLRDTAEIFDAPWIHAGMDETSFGDHPLTRRALRSKKKHELYADHVIWLHSEIRNLGRAMMMWGDHLLPHFGAGEAHYVDAEAINPRIARTIPKDIVICDWHYQPKPDPRTVDFLLDEGFTVVGCPAASCYGLLAHPRQANLDNLRDFARIAAARRSRGVLGMINTVWCPWRYFTGTTLFGIAFGAVCQQTGGVVPEDFPADFAAETFGLPVQAARKAGAALAALHAALPHANDLGAAFPQRMAEIAAIDAARSAQLSGIAQEAQQAFGVLEAQHARVRRFGHYYDEIVFTARALGEAAHRAVLLRQMLDQRRRSGTGKAAQAWLAREAAEAKALHRAALRLWDRQRYADDPMRAAGAKAGFDFFVQRLESTAKLVGTMACRRTKARAKPARQRTRNS